MAADLPAVVTDLEATLVATLRREEEAAADDLANSLLSDLDLVRAAGRVSHPELVLAEGPAVPIVEVAGDHLVGAGRNQVCVPLAHAVLRGHVQGDHPGERTGIKPGFSTLTLVARLRRWIDEDLSVRVLTTGALTFEGRLTRATPDHLAMVTGTRETCIAWGVLQEIRALGETQPFSLEDSG